MAKKPVKTGKRTQKGREAQIRRMVESRDQRATGPVAAPPQPEQNQASGQPLLQRRTAAAAAAAAARSVSRAEEYSFIMADLRRVGILAGGMFVILIALTFVLR
ncbi:MAG: hypothetical protein M1319_04590 [Chloroflexi bacterium]|nr:hypothetical protein [Chloroflexota bacterium]